MKYSWEIYGDDSLPKIAIIAPSNGEKWSEAKAKSIHRKIELLQELGFAVCVPKYENGALIFEPGTLVEGKAEIGNSYPRGVTAKTGAQQIIECAKNGWDIMPYIGGWGFVDKIGMVIKHFTDHPEKKLEKPIRIFGYSDCTFAAFLQSHHPDVFQAYATNILFYMQRDPEQLAKEEREIFVRNMREMQQFFKENKATPYDRAIVSTAGKDLVDMESVQYFPLHTDNIWSDAINFDKREKFCFVDGEMPVEAPKLNTSKPYILGLEGFLQKPTGNKKYDSQFPKSLDEFLRQRQEKKELPVLIEIGLFATRVDGANGYVGLLHNEETGLIEVNDFNIGRILNNVEQHKRDGKKPGLIKHILEVINTSPQEEAKYGNTLTKIPESVKEKLLNDQDLVKEDIAAILECENEKISRRMEVLQEVCDKYGVPTIHNTRCGHTLNIGFVGGGNVELSVNREQNKVTLKQLGIEKSKVAQKEQNPQLGVAVRDFTQAKQPKLQIT